MIAKEGRKYGLTCVLATQRPRDVSQDVLSQLGTLIVHRFTNEQDRSTVEHACGDLDRAAAQFIPMLAPGEAIIIGPDLPTLAVADAATNITTGFQGAAIPVSLGRVTTKLASLLPCTANIHNRGKS